MLILLQYAPFMPSLEAAATVGQQQLPYLSGIKRKVRIQGFRVKFPRSSKPHHCQLEQYMGMTIDDFL